MMTVLFWLGACVLWMIASAITTAILAAVGLSGQRRRFDTFLGRGRDTISERDHAALRRKIFNNTKHK